MALSVMMIALNICIFIAGVMLLTRAFQDRDQPAVRWMILLVLSICVISFCSLNVYIVQPFDLKVAFSRLRFIGFALISPSWLMFLVATFGRWTWLLKKPVTALIFAPGLVTIALTLVPGWNDFHVRDFESVEWLNFSVVSFKGGPWFVYHYVWALSLAVTGLAYGIMTFLRERGRSRRQVVLLVSGAALSLLVDVYVVTLESSLRWVMLSAATYIWTEGTVFYAVFRHGLLDLAPIAKERIFRGLPDPLLVLDEKERLQDFNEAAGRLFGLGPSSLRRSWRRLHPEVPLVAGEYCHREADQRARYFHVALESLSSAEQALGTMVCFREITAQKMIERDLNQNLEFRARLLSMVAHDVHGMMSAQTAFSSHLGNYVQPEYQGFVGALTERVYHSQNLMTNILVWARTQRANFVPLMRDYEINVLIKDVLNSLEDSVRLHRIQTEFVSEIDPLIVTGDPVMTESVVRNILRNAIRATPPGRMVRLTLRTDGKMVMIEVADEGMGLAPDRLRAILDSTADFLVDLENRPKGFGLGLTIARQFVALQGGEFSMESVIGQGTRVRFSVPL